MNTTDLENNEIYRNTYYGYDQDAVPVPEQSGGGSGGGYATMEQVNQAITDALNNITIEPVDEDTTKIDINGNVSTIDDVYLSSVEKDENTDEVVFNLNNGRPAIRVSVDELDSDKIDGSTF
jgi:hypothetical protein